MTCKCTPCMISQKIRGKNMRAFLEAFLCKAKQYEFLTESWRISHDGARHQWYKLNISLSSHLSAGGPLLNYNHISSWVCVSCSLKGVFPFPTLLHNIIFHNIILFSVSIFYVFPSVYICFARLCFFAGAFVPLFVVCF